jgi:primosomal protein N' (replication factor Y) (superfamily II helicase)
LFRALYIQAMHAPSPHPYVDVVFPAPPQRILTYSVPDIFREDLRPGHRVLVPLGRRRVAGFAVAFRDDPPVSEIKPIEDIMDPDPLFSEELLRLTRWVSDYYLAPWGETLRTALPPGLAGTSQLLIERTEGGMPGARLTGHEKAVLECVSPGRKVRLSDLEKAAGEKNLRHLVNRMEASGWVRLTHIMETGYSIKTEKWVNLRKEPSDEDLAALGKRSPRQAKILAALLEAGGEIRRSDLETDAAVLARLESAGWIEVWEEEVSRDEAAAEDRIEAGRFDLTGHQSEAVRRIRERMESRAFHAILLHGVTGSGKTQVYIEALRHCLAMGKQALILIPEISLTPQAVRRYRSGFENDVTVLHSRQSRGERYDAWRRLKEGGSRIALGPRSAVFAPLSQIGLIVVDEEHEPSYKQNDPAPRYHGRDTALVRGQMAGCTVILGSATPSLESYANATAGKYVLCELPERIDRIPMPSVTLIDQKEAAAGTESRIFTPPLIRSIRDRLAAAEQIILLQNRRGYASYLRCGACGHIETCPNCEISLTFHSTDLRMKCHYCGYQRPPADACPACGGASVQYRGTGTQRIEEEIGLLFPGAKVLRMDFDTMRKKGAHSRVVSDFENRTGDILLGTQIVAKGHDFPGVTLVGVVSADTGLMFPDFRSFERTFQLLTQAAGRAGRRDKTGEVIIQTLSADHPVLQFVRTHDFAGFFAWEMKQREELGYPPFGRLALVVFRGRKCDQTEKAAVQFAGFIDPHRRFEVLGPAAAPFARLKGDYRFQLIFRQPKARDPSGKILRESIRKALSDFLLMHPQKDIRVHVNVDPSDML